MNILLWVLQGALAWLSIAGGLFQIFKIEELQPTVAAMRELPTSLWALFGAVGIFAGVGLILPGILKKFTIATPIAAAVIGMESALISALYAHYGDSAPLPYSAAMATMGALIAIGRCVIKPLQTRK